MCVCSREAPLFSKSWISGCFDCQDRCPRPFCNSSHPFSFYLQPCSMNTRSLRGQGVGNFELVLWYHAFFIMSKTLGKTFIFFDFFILPSHLLWYVLSKHLQNGENLLENERARVLWGPNTFSDTFYISQLSVQPWKKVVLQKHCSLAQQWER